MPDNPFPQRITFGDKYGPAMTVTTQGEADAYFARLVDHMAANGNDGRGMTRAEAEVIERTNLGYWAGYYDAETRERVNRLYATSHPVFGHYTPTPDEALAAGKRLARASENEQQIRTTEML